MIPKNKMQAAIRSNPDKSASFVYMEIIRQHMEFEQKIKNYIKQNNMVTRGDKVLAGISGGADSTCLLYVLSHLKEQMGFELFVVHVNHGIRQEAQEDAVYVEKICKQLMIPFFLRTEDVPLIACREGLTEEEAGRSVRYAVFEELADKVGATKIAVAHNRNDLAETMLLNLFRGTGVHGAGAIRPVRGRIIRPLLDTERTEIEEYLRKKGISYQTDKTNLEDEHTRNRIRHHILPYAQQEINNKAVQHLARAAQEISEADSYIRKQAADVLLSCRESESEEQSTICLNLDKMSAQPEIIRKNVFLLCMEELTPYRKDITAAHISLLQQMTNACSGSSRVSLPDGLYAERRYTKLVIGKKREQETQRINLYVDILPEQEKSMEIPGIGTVNLRVFSHMGYQIIPSNAYTKWLDYDKIQASLVFRPREKGDYLVYDDQNSRQSIKKYMINEKIPAAERDIMYLLADGSHILWVPGYRISSYYKISENTKYILAVDY